MVKMLNLPLKAQGLLGVEASGERSAESYDQGEPSALRARENARSAAPHAQPAAVLGEKLQAGETREVPVVVVTSDQRHLVIEAALGDQGVGEASLVSGLENSRAQSPRTRPVALRDLENGKLGHETGDGRREFRVG